MPSLNSGQPATEDDILEGKFILRVALLERAEMQRENDGTDISGKYLPTGAKSFILISA